MPFITLTNVRKHLILNSMAGKVLLSVNRVRWRLHLCAIWCILVDYSCSCRAFQIWSFTLCRTKQAALADSRSHYMYPPLLSTTLISCPHSSTSLVFCDGGGGGLGAGQIRLLPQKLPITARRCVQQCCLRNAKFVNPVQLKGICELSF